MFNKEFLSKKKILTRFMIIFILPVFLLNGCTNDKGLKIGFEYDLNPESIMVAVKSEKKEFNVDDVTLEFYYGSGVEIGALSDENYERVGFVIYFINSKYLDEIEPITRIIDDYKVIDGFYFIKEIDEEDFFSDEYAIKINILSGKTFHHHETLTVPKEVLELSKGYFCLIITEIYYSQKDEGYIMNDKGFSAVHYEHLTEQEVRLSKPETSVFVDPS